MVAAQMMQRHSRPRSSPTRAVLAASVCRATATRPSWRVASMRERLGASALHRRPEPVTVSSSPPRREELGVLHEHHSMSSASRREHRARRLLVESRRRREEVKPKTRALQSRSVALANVVGTGRWVRLARVVATRRAVRWVRRPTVRTRACSCSPGPSGAGSWRRPRLRDAQAANASVPPSCGLAGLAGRLAREPPGRSRRPRGGAWRKRRAHSPAADISPNSRRNERWRIAGGGLDSRP